MNFINFKTAAGVFLGSVNLKDVFVITPNSTNQVVFNFATGASNTTTFAGAPERNAFIAELANVVKDAGRNNTNASLEYVATTFVYNVPPYFP